MLKKDFLWGSASAAYQIEGAAYIDGKGPSVWDIYSKVPGNTYKNTTGEVAIDFYHKFEEDIALMKEMGLKSYRFSVSWPRIFPKGKGEINQKGLEFYHKVIDTLIKNDIEPMLTIYHWDLPQSLQDEYGGWESREVIEDFTNYSITLFKEFGSKVKYWISLNEQNIFTTLGYLLAIHPPKVNNFQRFINVNHIANLTNASVIKAFREYCPKGLIGPSFAYGPQYANSSNPTDVLAMENALELQNYLWMDVYARGEYSPLHINLLKKIGITIDLTEEDKILLKSSKPDFMGVNYYASGTVTTKENKVEEDIKLENTVQSNISDNPTDNLFVSCKNEHTRFTDWGWTIDPTGLQIALRRITSRYNLPILITENGLGAYDTLGEDGTIHDSYRIDYLREHIEAIEKAVEDGCDVIGYCTWSFQDLFSWLNGYAKRYGFVYVDRNEESEKELKRYKKDSFYWYKKVIESNGKDM